MTKVGRSDRSGVSCRYCSRTPLPARCSDIAGGGWQKLGRIAFDADGIGIGAVPPRWDDWALNTEIAVLQGAVLGQIVGRAGPHNAAFLDDVVAVGPTEKGAHLLF